MVQHNIELKSKKLGCPIRLIVLAPDVPRDADPREFFESNNKMKVLWLLHGATGGPDDWIQSTSLGRYLEGRKVLVVLPSALNSDYSNYTVFANGFNFWDYFLEELMPFVYNWLPASDKPEDNYIAGYSMGGTGAMQFGFAHPEKFAGIGVLSSAVRDVDDLRPYRTMTSEQFRVEGTDTSRFVGTYPPGYNSKEINMIAKYPTVGDYLDSPENTWDRFIDVQKSGKLPRMYVTVGMEDRCFGRVKKFMKLAEELGETSITFDPVEGYDHNFEFWDVAIRKTLDFFEI